MQKKPSTFSIEQLRMLEIKSNSRSWNPVLRNGWAIKFSTYRDSNILLIFVSVVTGQTIVRYFADEAVACEYINYILSKDPSELIETP
jgi:hypothetical protein